MNFDPLCMWLGDEVYFFLIYAINDNFLTIFYNRSMSLKVLKTNFLQVPKVYCSCIDHEMGKCCFVEKTYIVTFNDHCLTLTVPVS